MVNRLENGQCLRCGTPLIMDFMGRFSDLHMCTSCDDFMRRQLYQCRKKKEKGIRSGQFYYKHQHPMGFVEEIEHVIE